MFGFGKKREGDKEKEREKEEKSDSEGGHRSAKTVMKSLWKGGLEQGKDQLAKGKQKLDEALGLGKTPNVIPPGKPDIHAEYREVFIGWHPVAGFAGTYFAEKTGLGRKITEKIHRYPDPTQHWAIIVGDYVHQLWMDENLHVVYNNEKFVNETWTKFKVGQTSFNDEALRQAGEMVIFNMREKKPAYNLISNNCQNFAVNMLEAIQAGTRRQFATTYAVYQRAIGEGTVMSLFEVTPEDEAADAAIVAGEAGKTEAVHKAEQYMEENTTKLDNHVPGRLHCC